MKTPSISNRRTDLERVIMRLAARQHGLVTRGQLVAAGVSPDVVDRRLRSGWLQRVRQGVYRVGPVRAPHSREMAAVLACGASATLSYAGAAALWQIPWKRRGVVVDVIVSKGRARHKPGVRVHYMSTLRRSEVTILDGIPVTTPARTLYDLAGSATRRELERALADVLARKLTTRTQLFALLRRHARQPGARALRALLESKMPPAFTRSEAESRFLHLVRRAQLAEPVVNTTVEGHEVDFCWRDERLVVEVDGRKYHASDPSFEGDRLRDAMLMAAGHRVMRVTWRQIVEEHEALLVRLTQALMQSAHG